VLSLFRLRCSSGGLRVAREAMRGRPCAKERRRRRREEKEKISDDDDDEEEAPGEEEVPGATKKTLPSHERRDGV